MNGMPYARKDNFWRRAMVVPCQAVVSKVRVIDQRIHIDCYDPETGEVWDRLPLLVPGGGLGSSLVVPPQPVSQETVQQPEEDTGSQVIVMPRHKQGPAALACAQHPASGYEDVPQQQQGQEQAQNPADDEEHPLPRRVTEHIWQHAGVRLQITGDGSLVIDTTASKKPVRIQLDGNQRLRISRGGSAGGRLTLWDVLEEHLEDLNKHLEYLNDYISWNAFQTGSLWQQIASLHPAAVAGFPPTWNTRFRQTPNGLGKVAAGDDGVPEVAPMGASAIDISKDVDH